MSIEKCRGLLLNELCIDVTEKITNSNTVLSCFYRWSLHHESRGRERVIAKTKADEQIHNDAQNDIHSCTCITAAENKRRVLLYITCGLVYVYIYK